MMPGHSLLLDTHVLIWMATEPQRLPRSMVKAIESAEVRLVSLVSAWEVQIKHKKHGRKFNFTLDQLEATMKAFSCTQLALDYADIRALNQMRFFHTDPFDRMLMSQASHRAVYLATLDQDIIKTFEREKAFYVFTDRARED